MPDHTILGQLVLGHSPVIARDRSVVATRLTLFPERRDAPPDIAGLLAMLAEVWPPADDGEPLSLSLRPLAAAGAAGADEAASSGAAPTKATPLLLNIASEPWLRALIAQPLPPHYMIELPAFMACDPAHVPALQALHAGGSALVFKGRPASELPAALRGCFRHALIDIGEERRSSAVAPEGTQRLISTIQVGARQRSDVDAAFERGAVAVLGWPLDGPLQAPSGQGGADLQVVMELIRRVDAQEPVDKLEAVLKNDPQLAFKLMRYLNSAAFGLAVELSSFQHALMMLGYQKLKRWLALLLASANTDPAMKPVLQAAVRRGLMMEELARSSSDDEMRGEMFICGVFSLLDQMLGQTFEALFSHVPVPERVSQALVGGSGPFQPYLDLVRALESGSRADIRDSADQAFVGLAEVNAALLRTLAAALALD